MGVSSIKDPDIHAAAAMSSLDAAALHLQKVAGITEGDVAGIWLPRRDGPQPTGRPASRC